MIKFLTIISTLLYLFMVSAYSQQAGLMSSSEKLSFIENKGQWPGEVRYLTKVGGMNAWITDYGVVYDYYKIERDYTLSEAMDLPRHEQEEFERENTKIKGHVVRMKYDGASILASDTPSGEREVYYNYLIGNDESKWAHHIRLFNEVEVTGLYEGIGIRYYGDNGLVRYDYKIQPGADLSQIQIQLEGTDGLYVNQNGELVIQTSLGPVVHGKLLAYQREWYGVKPVKCGFTLKGDGKVGIDAAGFNPDKELIVDPLIYSTFVSGFDDDLVSSITADDNSVVITGRTHSSGFPVTPGAYDTTLAGQSDIFVTKLNSTGSELIFSTFIGGDDFDQGHCISNASGNNFLISGRTYSSDYPTTPGVFSRTHQGGSDIIITQLNPDGSEIISSTLLGGGSGEAAVEHSTDSNGNIYLTGYSGSENFPTTPGAFQQNKSGMINVIAVKLNPNFSSLLYSTYIGGEYVDLPERIIVDQDGVAYIAGHSDSDNFPTTPNAYDPDGDDYRDGFILKLNQDGSNLIHSTLIGGQWADFLYDMVFHNDFFYAVGKTKSDNFPVTSAAYDTTINGDNDVFLVQLSSDLSSLLYATYIGGENDDDGWSLGINDSGECIIMGRTESESFPVTPDSYDITLDGESDIYILKMNTAKTDILYSSFLGGKDNEIPEAMLLHADGTLTITGETYSSDFPTTPGAFDRTYKHNNYWPLDVFVAKMNFDALNPSVSLLEPNGGEKWYAYSIQKIRWTANDVENITIRFTSDNGTTWRMIANPYPAAGGEYTWQVLNALSEECRFEITDLNHPYASDSSDSLFTIWYQILDLISPVGGEVWKTGSVHQILWDYNSIEQIKIEYSSNNGVQWTLLEESVPAPQGFYEWTLPNEPTEFAKIRISNADSSWPADQSLYPFSIRETVSVHDSLEALIPTEYTLYQNYPNPFNPTTTIKYGIPKASDVKVTVFNAIGQVVKEVLSAVQPAGYYEVDFDACSLSSGIYFYIITAQTLDDEKAFKKAKKMLLLK